MKKYIDADELLGYLEEMRQQAIADNKTKFGPLETTIDVVNSTIQMKVEEVMRIVNNMPAAEDVEPVRKWISCSERSPESGQLVLVWYEYFRYGNYNRMYQTYGVGVQYGGFWSGDVNGVKAECLAWMPLPGPPKMDGGSE